MNRRGFLQGTLVGAAALGAANRPRAAEEKKDAKKALLKAGHQNH